MEAGAEAAETGGATKTTGAAGAVTTTLGFFMRRPHSSGMSDLSKLFMLMMEARARRLGFCRGAAVSAASGAVETRRAVRVVDIVSRRAL